MAAIPRPQPSATPAECTVPPSKQPTPMTPTVRDPTLPLPQQVRDPTPINPPPKLSVSTDLP
eukprot:CAMPEP_0181206950 /NCGR_PEP_ID=MMETSP1096-20121128/21311_1 /TAXON_ID=156174 ORGANISM="Chrysochromulina ericina, Strain CCMP281" /NCGR_SAMPLE_ID=MMETSP1096 /ASSEMBLY_ACC=CAM_ASM_000453 /LENGTH=61 /DNA_ID=CAMNT_0023297889 /DNA_START=112 /DNA_END=297 /DNA_ORIENTATION=+